MFVLLTCRLVPALQECSDDSDCGYGSVCDGWSNPNNPTFTCSKVKCMVTALPYQEPPQKTGP